MAKSIKLKKFSLTIPQSYDDSITFYEILSKVNVRIDNINERLTALDGKKEEDTGGAYSDYLTDNNPGLEKYSLTLPQSYDDSLSYYEQLNNLAAYFNQMVDYVDTLSVSGMTPDQVAQLNKATQDIEVLTNKVNNLQPGTGGTGMTSEQIEQLNTATNDIKTINQTLATLQSSVSSNKTAIDKNSNDIGTNKQNIVTNADNIAKNTTAITTEANARTSADNAINQRLTEKADKSDTVTDVTMTHDETSGTYDINKTVNGETSKIGTITVGGSSTGSDVSLEQFNALSEKVQANTDTLPSKADKSDTVTDVSISNENGVYSLKQTKNGIQSDIGSIEVPQSSNPVVEVKDTVTENNTNGYDFHTLSETTEDGTENKIGHAYIAQNQITKLAKANNSLQVTSVDQSGNESNQSIELNQPDMKNHQLYIKPIVKFSPSEDIVVSKKSSGYQSPSKSPDLILKLSIGESINQIGDLSTSQILNLVLNGSNTSEQYCTALTSFLNFFTIDDTGQFHNASTFYDTNNYQLSFSTDSSFDTSSNSLTINMSLPADVSQGSSFTFKAGTDYYITTAQMVYLYVYDCSSTSTASVSIQSN